MVMKIGILLALLFSFAHSQSEKTEQVQIGPPNGHLIIVGGGGEIDSFG